MAKKFKKERRIVTLQGTTYRCETAPELKRFQCDGCAFDAVRCGATCGGGVILKIKEVLACPT